MWAEYFPNGRILAIDIAEKTLSLDPRITVLQGSQDAEKLAAATGEEGFLAKLSRFGLNFGDQDDPYVQQYKHELEQGHAVLAVVTKSDAEVEKAHGVLAEHGARFLTKFGKWAVEALESGNRERDPQTEPIPPTAS